MVKKCADCGLLRGEPGPACPWCTSINWEWQQVSGKGTIYSYQVVAHTVIPSFRDLTPFAIVLVELDEQRGAPTSSTASASPATWWTATSTWKRRRTSASASGWRQCSSLLRKDSCCPSGS